MKRGERVRWYLMAMGSEVDIHTPHWHANTVVIMHMRTDVGWLLPGTMQTADMKPMATGTWLFHCHVHDHIDAGMPRCTAPATNCAARRPSRTRCPSHRSRSTSSSMPTSA